MKTWIKKGLPLLLVLGACATGSETYRLFNPDRMIGSYQVDVSPLSESLQVNAEDDGWAKLGKGLANMALSNLDMRMEFHRNQACDLYVDGPLLDWFSANKDSNEVKIHMLYKVVQDSILYMKTEEDSSYSKWGIVRKFSDNYDHLQFLVFDEDEGDTDLLFNLNRK